MLIKRTSERMICLGCWLVSDLALVEVIFSGAIFWVAPSIIFFWVAPTTKQWLKQCMSNSLDISNNSVKITIFFLYLKQKPNSWIKNSTLSYVGRNQKRVNQFTKQDDFKSIRRALPSLYIQIFNFELLQVSTVCPLIKRLKRAVNSNSTNNPVVNGVPV